MDERNNSSTLTGRSDVIASGNLENTVTAVGKEGDGKAKTLPLNETKFADPGAQNTNESSKQKSGKMQPNQATQKSTTKIPVKSTKQAKKGKGDSVAKRNNLNTKKEDDDSLKTGENSFKIGHNRSKTEPFVQLTEDNNKQPEVVGFKTRENLESELLEKATNVERLEKQLNDLRVTYEKQQAEQVQLDNSKQNVEMNVANCHESEDVEKKIKLLSEENYELRERLLKKDAEIEELKVQEAKAQENMINKILRKENNELHHEKEQLKLERDRLRHLVNEKEGKAEKLMTGLKDMEDQLFEAKKALKSRANASGRLEDRLAKIDSELNRYRERYGKLERQNSSNKRPSEQSRNSRSRSLSPRKSEGCEGELNQSQKQITILQEREAKLLGDRRQLENSVSILSEKIAELEEKLRKSRSERRPTHERGSQTDLGAGDQLTSTIIQGSHMDTQGYDHSSSRQKGDAVKKCRGIVQSLGKFFEELIHNNQDTSGGGSKGRRTTIAAQRASELLHELSVSMEKALITTKHDTTCADRSTRTASSVRRSTAVDTDASRTLWDKLSDEVAQHEFTFDPLSPPAQTEGSLGIVDDKQREVKRAERGLQRMHKENGEETSEKPNPHSLTKEDATKMMNVSRKQTESVVKELLKKHHGEIRALLENASHSSPVPTVAFDIRNPEIIGQDEASMAVKELDCFKSRTTKVQSLILKLQEIVENEKNEKRNAEEKLRDITEEMRQKDTLLQAKSLELRRRHGKTLESEKTLQGEISALKNEKVAILKENARLHELCRQKDLQILQKVQEVKAVRQQVDERDAANQQNLAKMRKKVEEAWGLYESVKTRAQKRTAEFSEAAEKLKVSQGHLLDLWQTLKTVDNVANEDEEL